MDWLTLIVPAVFTTIGGLIVWYFQSRAEKLRKLEESLQDRRLKLYSDTLDPFVRIFAGIGDPRATGQVLTKMKGYDYRKSVFDLTMFGSDEVVRAYNALFQHIYTAEDDTRDTREMMRLWAAVMLAVRKSGGNPNTALDEWDMLAATIKDIEVLRNPPSAA